MKTLVVSLIFLPFAVAVLAVPLHRLVQPLWPETVVERLDEQNRPVLERVDRLELPTVIRSTPQSAAVVDRVEGDQLLGYVVGLRDAAGDDHDLPGDGFWWPAVVLPGCSLAVEVQRVVEWLPCTDVARVHHPNRITSVARLKIAVDRLIGPPAAVEPLFQSIEEVVPDSASHRTET